MANEDGKHKRAARTTIVGGQPPGNARDLESVPLGLERLLGMAAVDESIAVQLCVNRQAVIEGSGLELSPTERAVLNAIDSTTLEKMIAKVGENLADPERRSFLTLAAGTIVALAGGSALTAGLAGCSKSETKSQRITGARPDRPLAKTPTTKPTPASKASEPEPKPTAITKPSATPNRDQAGARADRPIGGLTVGSEKKDLPKHPKSRGIRPDRPQRTKGIRPDRPPRTRGLQPDRTLDPFED